MRLPDHERFAQLGIEASTVVMETPLALAGPDPGRRWNPLDVAVLAAVDTVRDSPLTSRHGDSDDPGFRASADSLAR